MGQPKIGAKIVLEGEAEYRNALKNINAAQKETRSEMKLWSTEFKNNQNSVDALTKKQELLTKQLEIQKQKVAACEEVIKKNTDAEKKAAERVAELQAAYDKAAKEMDEMKNNSDTTGEALDAQAKEVDELKSKLDLAQSGYEATSRKLTDYKTSLNYAQAEQRAMETELGRTEEYLNEARRATDGCASSIDRFGNETDSASGQTKVFGEVLKANLLSEVIVEGVKKLADGIKQIAASAVESGSSFEASMSQVAATMGMTAEEVDSGSRSYTLLSDAAKECGKSTMFSASEAADALNYLALAGYDAEKAAATLPKVLDLAAAGGLDLAYASDLVTDSMAALGLETEDLDNYMDEMARTSQKSNTSIAQLGEATLRCAGTVTLTGQSLETMNTELGVLANNGIKGAEGGTHLRNILLSLSAPTETASVAISELGLQVSDSQGNMRDLNDILVDLNTSMDGLSATEKTQMINQIFNKTDIAAVNALLKGTGREYDSLNNEIKNCSGAAADMAETLNNNLKGKVTILQSALEGLGISAYEIFDDEMKSSVDSATNAVGRLQKSMDNGELGVSMRRFSNSLADLVEGAIDFGEDALPVVIDGLTWLLDHSNLVVAGISGITAATVYHSTVAPLITTVTAAWEAYKTANEGATVAQWLMNAAMSANPAGLLVTAIVGLTAAIAVYASATRESNSELAQCNRETENLVKSAEEFNSATKESIATRANERESMENQAGVCRKLIGELESLQHKTALSKDEEIRMKMIVDQLNAAMPDLNLAIDEQTGLLNMSTSELKSNVEAMSRYAKAQAAREKLTEISKEQLDAELELAELERQRVVQIDAIADAEQHLKDIEEGTIDVRAEECAGWNETVKNIQDATEKQKELEEQIRATNETVGVLGEEYEQTCAYIEETEPIDTAASAINNMAQEAEDLGSAMTGSAVRAQAAYEEMCSSLTETISSQMNLFDEFNSKSEISKEQLLENMQSQVEGISGWADNMQELAARGIDQGLLQSLADMGPEGAGYVAAFIDMTEEELKEANKLYEESLSIPSDSVEKIADAYSEAGKMSGEGFKNGIKDQSKDITETAGKIGNESVRRLKQELQIQSPSKVTKEIGGYYDAGLVLGMKEGQANVVNTAANIAAEIVRTSKNGLQTTVFSEIGKQVTQGLTEGIISGKSGVVDAIVEMCTDAVAAAKKELDIHSPSRKFEYMGDMSAKGYIEGWESGMSNINAVIAQSLPGTSMASEKTPYPFGNGLREEKNINVHQDINIFQPADNMIELSRNFKRAQKEAAKDW